MIRGTANVGSGIETLLAAVTGLAMRDAAMVYADANIAVFPCVPGAKRPLISGGFRAATSDRGPVARWWERWPEANIGVPTGGGGVDVVDVDRHQSGSGFEALERARLAGLATGWAGIVRTPSGGVHLYYPADVDSPQGSWSVGDAHVDFRGTGGYVLVPPSRIVRADGAVGGYELIVAGHNRHPVDGEALRSFLRPCPVRPSPKWSTAADIGDGRIAAWLTARPEGTRNRALFWAACRYAEGDVSEARAFEVLGASAGRAGLGEAEIVATIRSAYRSARPAKLPADRPSARTGMRL